MKVPKTTRLPERLKTIVKTPRTTSLLEKLKTIVKVPKITRLLERLKTIVKMPRTDYVRYGRMMTNNSTCAVYEKKRLLLMLSFLTTHTIHRDMLLHNSKVRQWAFKTPVKMQRFRYKHGRKREYSCMFSGGDWPWSDCPAACVITG